MGPPLGLVDEFLKVGIVHSRTVGIVFQVVFGIISVHISRMMRGSKVQNGHIQVKANTS